MCQSFANPPIGKEVREEMDESSCGRGPSLVDRIWSRWSGPLTSKDRLRHAV
jgi:hypothetical protein